MDKQNVVYIYDGILFSRKKNLIIFSVMFEFFGHKLKNLEKDMNFTDTKNVLCTHVHH